MERRDAADALLDVEERARLQVPDPELVAAGRDEDGRPRVARAPRLAAAAEAARRGGGAVVGSNRTASLRASRAGSGPCRARRPRRPARPTPRRARCRGRARSTRGVHALPRAHAQSSSRPSRAPSRTLFTYVGGWHRTTPARSTSKHRTLSGTRRRAAAPSSPRAHGRSPRRRRAGGRRPSRSLCGNQIYGAFVVLHAIDATPLDGVAMPVPRRSTKPGRPRRRREMT